MKLNEEELHRLEWLSEEPTRDAPIIAKALRIISINDIISRQNDARADRIRELEKQLGITAQD